MNQPRIVEDFYFTAATASTAECADRVARIFNEAGIELSRVAKMVGKPAGRKARQRAADELVRVAVMLLRARPCLDRIEELHADER